MRLSLSDLVEKIDWVVIENGHGHGARLQPEDLAVGFYERKKNSRVYDDVRFRVGKDLMRKLFWRPKDKIIIAHHPDDLLSLMLIKSEGDGGVTLAQENNSPHCMFHFKWKFDLLLPSRKCAPTEYKHVEKGNYLVLRLNLNKDE